MTYIQLLRFLTIHFFSLDSDCNKDHIVELLLIKKRHINLRDGYITLSKTKVAINDLTAHCLGQLLPMLNNSDDYLFINS